MKWKPDWRVVRLVWMRELLDQARDRRTLFMVIALPVLLYPLLGLAVMQLALSYEEQPSVIGVVGLENLPASTPRSAGTSPMPAVALLGRMAADPAHAGLAAAFVLPAQLRLEQQLEDYPALFAKEGDAWRVAGGLLDRRDIPSIGVQPVAPDKQDELLDGREIDIVLIVPANLGERLAGYEQLELQVSARSDDRGQRGRRRLENLLSRWEERIKTIRLRRHGLPANFDNPIVLADDGPESFLEQAGQGLEDTLIRLFPFMVVMWTMAGAMYPAVDVCAGEKERGTLETLLISPAGRIDIACGKFLTIWVFSAVSTAWNLASMSLTLWMLTRPLPQPVPSVGSFAWSILASLPLAALFSSVCLAIGVYARSTKEGQYYLMPLFLLTLPLVFISLAPDITLNPLTAVVPVTGLTLLMQRVMTSAPAQYPWLYFIPVLFSIGFYSWLALWWAARQFQREEVLFRVK